MSERASAIPVSQEPASSGADRRHTADRRVPAAPADVSIAGGPTGGGRRGKRKSPWVRYLGIAGRDLGLVVGSVVAIVFSVRHVHPIFANQPTVAATLTKNNPVAPIAKAVLAPTPKDTSQLDRLVSSPQFEADRRKFAADLVATGRMKQERADSISYYAVREAYVRGIPPAVVFGVMLTENALFVSSAMSNVGAVGLMQVYPKVWLKALTPKFGADLASDSTNLKYGIFILSEYIKSKQGSVTAADLSTGLLHYNGCVRGTNTPHCHNYPEKVKTYVDKQGKSLCSEHKSFYDCIAKPFVAGFFGKRDDQAATQ